MRERERERESQTSWLRRNLQWSKTKLHKSKSNNRESLKRKTLFIRLKIYTFKVWGDFVIVH